MTNNLSVGTCADIDLKVFTLKWKLMHFTIFTRWSGFINPGPKSFGSAIRVRNARDEHPRGLLILNSRIQDRRSGPTEENMSEKSAKQPVVVYALGRRKRDRVSEHRGP